MSADLRQQLQTTLGGSYTLERELGGGGMSRVFVANETRLKRKVVVKVLSPELAQGISAERFEREIQLAASLQQANIVPLLSVGDMDGLPFYTMPFVEGESLRARLAKAGALPIAEAMSILRDVAKALGYAHERGIVHRDIKPDNVLLSGGTAVVADFGIAKALSAARTASGGPTLTQLGTSIGTPTYIAPEQAAGDPDIDHRADIYSFGCMAYELFAGQPPFVAKTPQRLLAAHMSEQPRHLQEHRPDLPPTVASLVMRCLAKEANDRPQSAGELLTGLETSAGGSHELAAMPAILLGGRGMLQRALLFYGAAFVAAAVLAKAAIVGIGLPDWVFPGTLVVMALGFPVILFTGYVHHVARRLVTHTPTLTPHGSIAPQGTMATIAVKATPHVSWRRTALGGALALGGFVALIGIYMVLRAMGIGPAGSLLAKGALAANDKILIADFRSPASDTSLGPVVTEAFRTGLGQSSNVVIMQPTAVRDVIRRMQRPPDSRVDFALAREIATREGLKAVIDGEVLGVGGTYVISVRLLSTATGEPLAQFRETAESAKNILPTVDRLTKDLRARIGESLRSVQAAPPLERVTTASLEALRKFVQGARAAEVDGDFPKGAALLEEAIQLDTGFAMAYRKLGVLYNNNRQAAKAMPLLQKAFDHRDRLSDAERYLTIGTYYQNGPHQDRDKAIAAYESLLDLQPDNSGALNNVALLYADTREFAKAEAAYEKAIASNVLVSVLFTNLAITQSRDGKINDAERTYARFAKAMPGNPEVTRTQANLAYARGQYDSAQAIVENQLRAQASNPVERTTNALYAADLAKLRGHLAAARQRQAEAVAAFRSRAYAPTPVLAALYEAQLKSWFEGDQEGAARILDAALASHPLDSITIAERPYAQLVAAYAQAGRPDKAKAMMASFDRARVKVVRISDERTRHQMLGAIALSERRFQDAIAEFRAADQGACVVCPLPDLARAYDLAGNADSAIAIFSRYLVQPDLVARPPIDGVYLAGTYKRLGELWDAKGDRQKAAAYYGKMLDLWKTADSVLQPKVQDVRQRFARLGDSEKH